VSISKKIKVFATGEQYGKWTVLDYVGEKGRGRNSYWKCQCVCGETREVCGSLLRTGKSTQCQVCSGKQNGRIGLYSKGKQQHLYIVRCGEFFKIGVSDNPERRIKDLETSNPFPIEVLYIGHNEGHEEKLWHDIFEHRHHRGEWFQV
jgi:hypothetical protein